MKKLALLSVAVLVFGLFAMQCSPTPTPEPPTLEPVAKATDTPVAVVKHGGELILAVPAEPPNGFDPHKVEAAAAFQIAVNVFDTLVRSSPKGEIVPGLAEDWQVSEDGLTYTFQIRKNARFHNGRPVTAQDAAFSLRRILDEKTESPKRSDYAAIVDVQTPDDYTLVLKTESYNAPLLANLARGNAAIVPEEAVDSLTNAPIGSGPFKFVEWAPGSHIVLDRFDAYWDGDLPYLDRVEFRFIPDPATAIAALRAGDVDVVVHAGGENAAEVESDADLKIVSGPQNLVQFMAFNEAEPPFDNKLVRQAIVYAVDKQAIIEGAAWGFGTPLGTHMSPVLAYYNPEVDQVYTYDPAKAKELLAEAGYENGFEATLSLPEPYTIHIRAGEIIADQLKDVGINLKLEIVEWGAWLSDIYGGRKYQLTVVGFVGHLDPDPMMNKHASDHNRNFWNYNNPEVDALLAEGRETVGFEARKSIYDRIQMLLAQDAVSLYIQDPHNVVGMKKDVEGYKMYPLYVVDLRDVYRTGE
jgi:peptide/nickel transport system substrate-binding protein